MPTTLLCPSSMWEGEEYVDKGTILGIEKERLLKFSYLSSMSGLEDKPENYAEITYQLDEGNGKTALSITQKGFKDQKTHNHSRQGWEEVLEEFEGIGGGMTF